MVSFESFKKRRFFLYLIMKSNFILFFFVKRKVCVFKELPFFKSQEFFKRI